MQAIDFWSTVCYCEGSILEDIADGLANAPMYLKLVEQAAPLLVPIMLETLTKQQVSLPPRYCVSCVTVLYHSCLFLSCCAVSVLFHCCIML